MPKKDPGVTRAGMESVRSKDTMLEPVLRKRLFRLRASLPADGRGCSRKKTAPIFWALSTSCFRRPETTWFDLARIASLSTLHAYSLEIRMVDGKWPWIAMSLDA